jgi:uncharacterized protein YehS (DUF1456 family)
MTNNDILRRLRYTFDFSDSEMIELFALGNLKVSREQISAWLKSDEDANFKDCDDKEFTSFLDGLIIKKRGPKDESKKEETRKLNNNIIFNKIKISLNLKAEEVLEILQSVDFDLSKHELSAFFRKSDHKHFRACQDQVLRNFLNGLQLKYRENIES